MGCHDLAPPEPTAAELKRLSAAAKGPGVSGRHRAIDGWRPAEFGRGIAKFKDPGVYVDGVPVGMLKFGELPVPLKPTWYVEKAAVSHRASDPGPRFKMVKQRRYRFRDYFRALGININRIRSVHLYGGSKRAVAITITGQTFRNKKNFTFRFGHTTWGKPIPACPPNFADGNCPDNIRAVAVYIKRKPPKRQGGSFFLDGKRVAGIPYFGEPLRGGVRVYLDGPLVTTIKRRKLAGATVVAPDGTVAWKFFPFLKSKGVDTTRIKEAWVIHDHRRRQRLSREQLVNATFVANSQRRGIILFGDKKFPTKALALHTSEISKDALPVFMPHETDG